VADTLDAWLRLRPTLTVDGLPPPIGTTGPTPSTTTALIALARHIEVRVRPRDEARGARFDDAVSLLATLVGRAPDVDGFAALAARLHGVDAPLPLRTATAHAHGGRAVMRPFPPTGFDDVVRSADVVADGPAWFRAARLYADVCFFHPFDDGNARLALCALVWVLERARVGVVDLAPVVMPWTPSSTPSLCRVVRAMTGPLSRG
jgi:hypothetical protein